MSFDPVSYAAGMAAGKKAGGGGGGLAPLPNQAGSEEILNDFEAYDSEGNVIEGNYIPPEPPPGPEIEPTHYETVVENGQASITPMAGYEAMREVSLDVQVSFPALVDQASEEFIFAGKEAYDGQGNVIRGEFDPPIPLQNQANANDIRQGKSTYTIDSGGINIVDGTLTNIHRPIPVYWDNANGKFTVSQDMLAMVMNTIGTDGAITAYLVNAATAPPIPCLLYPDANNNLILTGGVVMHSGSDTDKYIVECTVGADGSISNDNCSLIRLITTVSRHLSDWMADGDYYLAMYLLA